MPASSFHQLLHAVENQEKRDEKELYKQRDVAFSSHNVKLWFDDKNIANYSKKRILAR